MRILLTGASGFIGGHLLPRLVEAGHQVIVLRRGSPTVSADEWQGPSDLREIENRPDWPTGIDAVVHLGAANPAWSENVAHNMVFLREANLEGTLALARRSAREGVKRFVFLSSANVHAPRFDGQAITERDALNPQSPYAASKAEAEAGLCLELADTLTQYCILRPAPVFGRGGRGTVAQLARLAATPLPLPLNGLGGRRSLIAVEDLVDAVALAIAEPSAAGRIFLLAGGSATPAEIVRALRRGAGRPSRLLPAPSRLAGAIARRLGEDRTWDNLTRDFVLDTTQAEESLGWRAKRDLETRLGDAAGLVSESAR